MSLQFKHCHISLDGYATALWCGFNYITSLKVHSLVMWSGMPSGSCIDGGTICCRPVIIGQDVNGCCYGYNFYLSQHTWMMTSVQHHEVYKYCLSYLV